MVHQCVMLADFALMESLLLERAYFLGCHIFMRLAYGDSYGSAFFTVYAARLVACADYWDGILFLFLRHQSFLPYFANFCR